MDNATAAATADWDPDLDPVRLASGIGHNLLELYVRLERMGLDVTVGRAIPSNARLVVYYQHAWARLAEIPLAMRAASYRTAVIRSDAPLWWDSLLPPDLVIAPNRASVWTGRYGTRWVHLPALPQRGIVPRNRTRRGLETVAFKGNPGSVPGYLLDPDFRAELSTRGLTLVTDVPRATDGSDQRWHDFSDVDVVLCLRGAAPGDSLVNKPATRLINAWSAGAVPLVAAEPAYLELVNDGVDGLVVQGPADIVDALDHLLSDSDALDRMYRASRERGGEFGVDSLLDTWAATLEAAAGNRFGAALVANRRSVVARNVGIRIWRSLVQHTLAMVERSA